MCVYLYMELYSYMYIYIYICAARAKSFRRSDDHNFRPRLSGKERL